MLGNDTLFIEKALLNNSYSYSYSIVKHSYAFFLIWKRYLLKAKKLGDVKL